MGCERSVITMTLLRLGYLVHSLGNRTMTLPLRLASDVKVKFWRLCRCPKRHYFRVRRECEVINQIFIIFENTKISSH